MSFDRYRPRNVPRRHEWGRCRCSPHRVDPLPKGREPEPIGHSDRVSRRQEALQDTIVLRADSVGVRSSLCASE